MLPWRAQGWYARTFDVSNRAIAENRRTVFVFEGVMSNPSVYVNGALAGSWRYGYNSFIVDATDHVRPGTNLISVHVDNTRHQSRWYPGAGIYRDVSRVTLGPVSVPIWGVSIETPVVTDERAVVRVTTEIRSSLAEEATVELVSAVLTADGSRVAERSSAGIVVPPGETVSVTQELELRTPRRWDVADPHLYTLRTRVLRSGQQIDETSDRFGVRTFEWTSDDGFHLNGRRLQIRGVNLHHDNGPLGGAAYRDAIERKLRIMMDMGANSIRTSHNPPSPHLLELCDELGLVVINELYDKWGPTASVDVDTATYIAEYAEAEITNFIRRDRNHPSVVMWSIGNEIPDVLRNEDGRGAEHVAAMNAMFKGLDPTRPTNMGLHVIGSAEGPILSSVDTQGWNYGAKYRTARRLHPGVPMIYTESASAFSTRGYYAFPHPAGPKRYSPDFTESSYDRTAAQWSDIPDVEFDRMERDRYVAGEYVWTGFDYLGEPTPHTDHARSSYFGIVDLVGIPKDRFFLYRSHWNERDETVHVLPHWTWPGREGQRTPIYVYTSGEEAEVFVNGRSLGRRTKQGSGRATGSNLAIGATARATSEEIVQDVGGNVIVENRADKAVDGSQDTRWCADTPTFPQTLTIDLEREESIAGIQVDWEQSVALYDFVVEAATAGGEWVAIADRQAGASSGRRWRYEQDLRAEMIRVTVTGARNGVPASIRELVLQPPGSALASEESPYYEVMDRYRLRWEDAVYEPGIVRAVAYREGVPIGEASVETAGEPVRLRLTPERSSMPATGDALTYVLVEAIDHQGRLCPHSDAEIRFTVDGPASIAGIGNGNPIGFDPFHDDRHPLFYGKAMLILRSKAGASGPVRITAIAPGLEDSSTTVQVTAH